MNAQTHLNFIQQEEMNIKIHLAVLLFALLAVVSAQQKPLPLENLDVDNTLKNKKLVDKYVECVLEKGRCDSNGRDLKGNSIFF